jgi:hypothetical protein
MNNVSTRTKLLAVSVLLIGLIGIFIANWAIMSSRPPSVTPLDGTRWRLISLDGQTPLEGMIITLMGRGVIRRKKQAIMIILLDEPPN